MYLSGENIWIYAMNRLATYNGAEKQQSFENKHAKSVTHAQVNGDLL